MKMPDFIAQFCEDLSFDALKGWCDVLNVEYEEPACDDDWPDWTDRLRVKVAEALEHNPVASSIIERMLK